MSGFDGRRVVVVGLGVSGLSAARALVGLGATVRVTEAGSSEVLQERAQELEQLGVEVELGGHDPSALDGDLAVISPGIPPTTPVIRALDESGIETISEVELAFRVAKCEFLAVTGTNGKTTTTSLLAAMVAEGGIETAAAGNIGLPLIDVAMSLPSTAAVAVEVSSFQLAKTVEFKPRAALLLNVAEDHTDWHGSFSDYASAKARIVANQGPEDVFLPNYEDAEAMSISKTARSRVVPFSGLRVPDPDESIGVDGPMVRWRGTPLFAVSDVPLPGAVGLEDSVAAAGAALEYGIDPRAVARALKGFKPLGHRLEVVAEAEGVTFIDDSKATNPHATLAAVRGLEDVVLIAGGRSKGIDLSPLATTVPPVRAVVALGEARSEIASVFEGLADVVLVDTMAEAVEQAASRSISGGSVLLSPGCASLDMYTGYAARGEDFARCVKELIGRWAGGEGGH